MERVQPVKIFRCLPDERRELRLYPGWGHVRSGFWLNLPDATPSARLIIIIVSVVPRLRGGRARVAERRRSQLRIDIVNALFGDPGAPAPPFADRRSSISGIKWRLGLAAGDRAPQRNAPNCSLTVMVESRPSAAASGMTRSRRERSCDWRRGSHVGFAHVPLPSAVRLGVLANAERFGIAQVA